MIIIYITLKILCVRYSAYHSSVSLIEQRHGSCIAVEEKVKVKGHSSLKQTRNGIELKVKTKRRWPNFTFNLTLSGLNKS